MSVIQLSARDLQNKLACDIKPLLLDVREPDEFQYTRIDGTKLIPLGQIAQRMNEIDSTDGCVIICHHGIRSQQVAAYLVRAGLTDIYNLSGGIEAWSVDCDSTVLRY